jgi:hypothetical protein
MNRTKIGGKYMFGGFGGFGGCGCGINPCRLGCCVLRCLSGCGGGFGGWGGFGGCGGWGGC